MVQEIKNAQVYEWHDRKGDKHWFSIDIALHLLSKRASKEPDYQASWKEAQLAASRNPFIAEMNFEHAMTTDLTKPIIFASIPDMDGDGRVCQLLIDGWHRVIKFLIAGVHDKTLPGYILTVEETKKCKGIVENEQLVFRPEE